MQTSQAGLNLIKEFEGCKLKAYKCPAGIWTIGYGWTHGVKEGDEWNQEMADRMLVEGIKPFETAVNHAIAVAKTTQAQFDAMVSLCYNVGPANFQKSSVVRYHRDGNHAKAAESFLLWNKGGGRVLSGLVRRREAEKRLYLSKTGA